MKRKQKVGWLPNWYFHRNVRGQRFLLRLVSTVFFFLMQSMYVSDTPATLCVVSSEELETELSASSFKWRKRSTITTTVSPNINTEVRGAATVWSKVQCLTSGPGRLHFVSKWTSERHPENVIQLNNSVKKGSGLPRNCSTGPVIGRSPVPYPPGTAEDFPSQEFNFSADFYSVSVPFPCFRNGT